MQRGLQAPCWNFILKIARQITRSFHLVFRTEAVFKWQEGANLRGQCAPDALCCPRLRRSAPPCRGSIPGGSVHDVSGARSECAVRPCQRHWHMSGVGAFSFCERPEHLCRLAAPLRNKVKTNFLLYVEKFNRLGWHCISIGHFSFVYISILWNCEKIICKRGACSSAQEALPRAKRPHIWHSIGMHLLMYFMWSSQSCYLL